MTLLLLRHGNTFDAGQTPVIVGRSEDLPLTAEGEAQAERAAIFLKNENLIPQRVYCGNLQRTKRMAAIICTALNLSEPSVDERLTEIDYGDWGGLTAEEVRARFGEKEWEEWEAEATMPAGRNWSPAAATIEANVKSFSSEIGDMPALAVTSNGLLRFFARLDEDAYAILKAEKKLKVATGHLCRFDRAGDGFKLTYWNRSV